MVMKLEFFNHFLSAKSFHQISSLIRIWLIELRKKWGKMPCFEEKCRKWGSFEEFFGFWLQSW